MRAFVRMIDVLLRKKNCVYEFTQDAECIFRLQNRAAPHTVTLGSFTISKGDPVLVLHIWNERMPKISVMGAGLGWAVGLKRRLIYSFKQIARLLQDDPRGSQVRAVFAASALFSFTDHTGGLQMMQHLGFTVMPYYRPYGRFGEFWENLFSWWLMWTFNAGSLQSRKFWKLQRTEMWMIREEFLQRFG